MTTLVAQPYEMISSFLFMQINKMISKYFLSFPKIAKVFYLYPYYNFTVTFLIFIRYILKGFFTAIIRVERLQMKLISISWFGYCNSSLLPVSIFIHHPMDKLNNT